MASLLAAFLRGAAFFAAAFLRAGAFFAASLLPWDDPFLFQLSPRLELRTFD